MKRTALKRKTPLKSKTCLKQKTPLRSRSRGGNPVPTAENICELCGRPFAHTHEAFHGTANRKLSQKYGLTFHLCQACHQGTEGVHGKNGHALDMEIKRTAQERFEIDHSRDEFIALFGRNYCEDEVHA